MITRKELLQSKEFWLARFQAVLYEQVENYLKENNISKTEFAAKLGVSKGYVSQILNGDFDHKISKLIELSLIIEKAPLLKLEEIDNCVLLDSLGMLDTAQGSPIKINVSLNFTKHVTIKKGGNLGSERSFNKNFSGREYSTHRIGELENESSLIPYA